MSTPVSVVERRSNAQPLNVNVVLTVWFDEGLSTFIFDLWRGEFRSGIRGRLAYLLLRPGIGRIRRVFDYERAILHGVGNDGRNLVIMPSFNFAYLSDEDLGAIVAYLKSLPPIDNEMEARKLAVPAYMLFAAGMAGELPVDMIDQTAVHPAAVRTADRAD